MINFVSWPDYQKRGNKICPFFFEYVNFFDAFQMLINVYRGLEQQEMIIIFFNFHFSVKSTGLIFGLFN